ncbi:hypothetical protein IGI04_009707 [Brassica rapa subsp. trilocularis]|uniref:RRM domain-containing protein n=1 Tax=Brassica rapa subsp. trilocularis TaxID=1813537 RepID=A0ABQ7MZ34_BRACM|nr:hypothetical protein IGI04_009707 [Brassica rapa subsp. trilocularis]
MFVSQCALRMCLSSSLRQLTTTRGSCSKLFVGGLSYDTNEPVLKNEFEKYGEVLHVRVICDHKSGKSKGYGFVVFDSEEAAATALASMDNQLLEGRHIRVEYAQPKGGEAPKLKTLHLLFRIVTIHALIVFSSLVQLRLFDVSRGDLRGCHFRFQASEVFERMVRISVLNDALKSMFNAEKRGKRQVMIRPSSKVIIKFLIVMQKHGYIGEFEYVDDHRSGKIVVELNGRLNKCGVISPRFDVGVKEIEGWTARLLPSRQFGYIVLTTSAGIMDHEEARRKNVGGKVLGFFY